MLTRLDEEINELRNHLEEFESIDIPEFNEYQEDKKTKAACERYFERVIETIISIAFLLIKNKKLITPETEEHAFIILAKNKIIDDNLAGRLKEAKDMRNIVIHNYKRVNDEIVYNSVTEEIINDAKLFLKEIEGKR